MTTHGLWQHPLYGVWCGIRKRCLLPSNAAYKNYGGRGITLYEEWIESPVAFISYVEKELGDKPSPEHSLDREDNDGNYEPGNLRWATRQEQADNRRHSFVPYTKPNHKLSKCGFRWVTQKGERFIAQFRSKGQNYHCGTFSTPEEAHAASLAKRKELGL